MITLPAAAAPCPNNRLAPLVTTSSFKTWLWKALLFTWTQWIPMLRWLLCYRPVWLYSEGCLQHTVLHCYFCSPWPHPTPPTHTLFCTLSLPPLQPPFSNVIKEKTSSTDLVNTTHKSVDDTTTRGTDRRKTQKKKNQLWCNQMVTKSQNKRLDMDTYTCTYICHIYVYIYTIQISVYITVLALTTLYSTTSAIPGDMKTHNQSCTYRWTSITIHNHWPLRVGNKPGSFHDWKLTCYKSAPCNRPWKEGGHGERLH